MNNRSRLIFKFLFNHPLFLEEEILSNWSYSETILVTAYDIYRDDLFCSYLQRTGMTLKEYLQNQGLPKNIKILADTGIFELESRKNRTLKRELPLEEIPNLTTNEIFQAYELIDPDLLISPDEIILVSDTDETINQKVDSMQANLRATLDRFDPSRVMATLQGTNKDTIDKVMQNIASTNIKKIARGGLIPLFHDNYFDINSIFRKVIKYSYEVAKDYQVTHLHGFGLPRMQILKDYFCFTKFHTVDTSGIYFKTAKHRYLTKKGKYISVNRAFFENCMCTGCIGMEKMTHNSKSGSFMAFLYIHNCISAQQYAHSLKYSETYREDLHKERKRQVRNRFHIDKQNSELILYEERIEKQIDASKADLPITMGSLSVKNKTSLSQFEDIPIFVNADTLINSRNTPTVSNSSEEVKSM